jgi:hypothetical protein
MFDSHQVLHNIFCRQPVGFPGVEDMLFVAEKLNANAGIFLLRANFNKRRARVLRPITASDLSNS